MRCQVIPIIALGPMWTPKPKEMTAGLPVGNKKRGTVGNNGAQLVINIIRASSREPTVQSSRVKGVAVVIALKTDD